MRVLPEGVKGLTILGDLHEEFREVARARGPRRARLGHLRATLGLALRYGVLRKGRRRKSHGRGGERVSSIFADLRFGFRMLARTPGLSAIAVLTIACGVGLTTHMYSSVHGSVIRGLPVPGAERLVHLEQWNPEQGVSRSAVPWLDYLDLAARESGLEEVAGFYQGTVNLAGEEAPPERFQGAFVTANALRVVGVEPLLGRVFLDGEDGPDAGPRVVLSFHVWQNRFAGDPQVVGRTIRANGEAAEVIGVMPDGFRVPFREDLWVPIAYDPATEVRRSQFMDVFGRIPVGRDAATVQGALDAVASELAAIHPESNAGWRFRTLPYAERYMPREITAVLFLMLAATFGVLLIACANVANLLLARASLRTAEVAIRTAMGASRLRVVRQLLAEALTIALVGGALGVVVAWIGVDLFNAALAGIERPYWIDIRLDGMALLFALGVTLVASVAAGIYPALRASGLGIGDILRDETRGSSSLRIGRFSYTLVVGEVAVSCALLVTAGFMIKSVANLRTVDLGFEPEAVLTGRVGIFESEYPTVEDRAAFFRELEAGAEALPGAQVAALASVTPGLGASRWLVTVEGEEYADPRDHPEVNGNVVTRGYFDAIGTPLLIGRDFTAAEVWDATEPVAIVNESFVQTVLQGRGPIGTRVKIGRADSSNPFARIVGVVPDTHVGGGVGGIGDDRIDPEQLYVTPGPYDARFMAVVVRAEGEPGALAPSLRRLVSDIDADVPVYYVQPLSQAMEEATWAFELFGSLFVIFGAVALFLAAVGLYGVMAFSVGQRRQEMGVRMALGAGPRTIVRLVLRRGVAQLVVGMALGLGLGFAMSRPLQVVTYDVDTGDPVVYGSIVATLALAGLLASFVPARAATRSDPADAMRR